jgi:hypothetical protein
LTGIMISMRNRSGRDLWDAIAADGKLFTALLADLTLTPVGDQVAALSAVGTFWLPPSRFDAEPSCAIVRCQATAVIGSFLDLVACQLAHPAGTAGRTSSVS